LLRTCYGTVKAASSPSAIPAKKFTAFPRLREDREKIHSLPRSSGSIVKKFTAFPRLREDREKIHKLPRSSGSIVKKFTASPRRREGREKIHGQDIRKADIKNHRKGSEADAVEKMIE
jgi:hypothetical protein